ncbi:carbonic anhydrase [Candidatus Marinamargulisbacteria bacterium SCGC AG-439-L15]|nr:carbonic anhydrase [Candidatus Marinamargulisbacteria bacterium SCGC AG-439-L15]
MIVQTKATQDEMSMTQALELLKEGNHRFVNNQKIDRDLALQVNETSAGQYPFAAVLGCIDSRVPVEMVFDQGIGDIFVARVAGNVVNEDILGSLEYACKVAGSKVIVVLGHSKCGAVTSACQSVELGNITALLEKIKPSVNAVLTAEKEADEATIELVTKENIKHSIKEIKKKSLLLNEMVTQGVIQVVGAYYDVATGKVTFLE